MSKIKIVMDIRDWYGTAFKKLSEVLKNAIFQFDLVGFKVYFKPNVKSIKKDFNSNNSLNYEDIRLCFQCEIEASIDIEKNILYDNSLDLESHEINSLKFLESTKKSLLDEDFSDQIDLFCEKIVQALVLTIPGIELNTANFTVFLNRKKFRVKSFIKEPSHKTAYQYWNSIFKTELNIIQTWEWLQKNGTKSTNKANCPVVSVLSYILNREYHEILLYCTIGLEFLFLNKNDSHRKSYSLQNRIHAVLPDVSTDQIKQIYKIRSDLAHGETEVGSCNLLMDILSHECQFEKEAFLACAIFFETIRMLIANDAIKFTFVEKLNVEYSFE